MALTGVLACLKNKKNLENPVFAGHPQDRRLVMAMVSVDGRWTRRRFPGTQFAIRMMLVGS